MSTLRGAAKVLSGLAAAGTAVLAYSLAEARWPVLRRYHVPVLAGGEEPITILHLSDLHLTDRTEARVAWVRSLAELHPDVVIDTGDNLSLANGVEPLHRALEPFLELPGAFVMGDHDYYATDFQPPTKYLRRDSRNASFWARREQGAGRPADDAEARAKELRALPWREVAALQASGGWVDLTNRRGAITVRGRRIDLVGVDDPHADRDDYPAAAPEPAAGEAVLDRAGRALRLGLVHAPYQRILDAMSHDGVSLALAGHTHGGQLCLPFYGALLTNCDLDRKRASGLSQWPGRYGSLEAADDMYLHVSAGVGTSPFTPVRLACRPEASLITLLPG